MYRFANNEIEGGFIRSESEEPPRKAQRVTRNGVAASSAKNKGKGKAISQSKGKGKSMIPVEVEVSSSDEGSFSIPVASTQPTSCDDEPGPSTARAKPRQRRTSSRGKTGRRKSYKVSDDENDEDDDYVESDDAAADDDDEEIKFQAEAVAEEDDAVPEAEPVVVAPKRKRAPKPKGDKPKKKGSSTYYERATAALHTQHPELITVFDDLEAEKAIEPEKLSEPPGLTVTLLPFQKEGLNWLLKQEASRYNGGILADEMGMGKTIQTIALFMADKDRKAPILVIAPTVAIMQWRNEIDQHTGGSLSMLVFHGQNRTSSMAEIMKHDVVLTTYSLVGSVYRKQQSGFRRKNGIVKEASLLHKVNFHRVVLDEAHNIKDRNAITSKAVYNLQTEKRLCLTGTPLQNRIGEMYSLLRFLQVRPFCENFCRACECRQTVWKFNKDYCDFCGHHYLQHTNFFNHSMLKHLQGEGNSEKGQLAMSRLRLLLSRIMLRRTKVERADDLGLPPRVVEIRRDFFNEEETDVYSSIYSDTLRTFNTYVAQGVVLNNYANIFSLITRMRQMADHPDLVLRRHAPSHGAHTTLVCQLCDDEAEEALRSKCHHTFCRLCIKEYCEGWAGNEEDLKCPVCHVPLTIDLTAVALKADVEVVKKGSIVNRINMDGGWRSSTKIEALVEELYKLRSDRQTIKSIVFSQFTSMLDLVEWRLNKAGFQTVKLQGSMSPSQREGIIKHFMETPSVEIFLVSLKAGGVALNLCEASQVFILDPWWNPSVEWQSGDRVHRIGQHRPVKITRLVIEDSIESRIIQLQEKKATMIQATVGQDDAAMNRLTPADMQFLFVN